MLLLSHKPVIVVISDRIAEGSSPEPPAHDAASVATTTDGGAPRVVGGYLERLPLACIAAGIVEQAEIWHHADGGSGTLRIDEQGIRYRGFPIDGREAPFRSTAMLEHLRETGAPHILVVFGLGVDRALLDACAASIRIYNSIDAPALRIPERESAAMDLVLTGAQWQSDEVEARHPGMATAIIPVGPEFAAIDQFRPLGEAKTYDLIYVAAAQAYKRHDMLFDALAACPPAVRALCVFGYGEMADALRDEAAARGLAIDFIGPPGVPFEEVNQLMNLAKFGVVCGRDDGAPAILTEYMLAGLPVLANAELVCGQQYILPQTGMVAPPADFAAAIMTMRETYQDFAPRQAVLARWTWQHTIEKLRPLLDMQRERKKDAAC